MRSSNLGHLFDRCKIELRSAPVSSLYSALLTYYLLHLELCTSRLFVSKTFTFRSFVLNFCIFRSFAFKIHHSQVHPSLNPILSKILVPDIFINILFVVFSLLNRFNHQVLVTSRDGPYEEEIICYLLACRWPEGTLQNTALVRLAQLDALKELEADLVGRGFGTNMIIRRQVGNLRGQVSRLNKV